MTHVHCGHTLLVKVFIYFGQPVDTRDHTGHTALHYAARYGYSDMAKFLIHRGAEANPRTWSAHTPLHLAVMHGQYDLAELLLEKGADPNAVDFLGFTPLHHAVSRFQGYQWGLDRKGMVEALLAAGADPSLTDGGIKTPANLATHNGFTRAARLLEEALGTQKAPGLTGDSTTSVDTGSEEIEAE